MPINAPVLPRRYHCRGMPNWRRPNAPSSQSHFCCPPPARGTKSSRSRRRA